MKLTTAETRRSVLYSSYTVVTTNFAPHAHHFDDADLYRLLRFCYEIARMLY
jgi:hypothetical protein